MISTQFKNQFFEIFRYKVLRYSIFIQGLGPAELLKSTIGVII